MTRLSHLVIKSLYDTLKYCHNNPGLSACQEVSRLFQLWRSFHATFVNVSQAGWNALMKMAHGLNLYVSQKDDDRWLFLFAVETYLNLLIRSMALAKLGKATQSLSALAQHISSMKKVFGGSVFEWVFALTQQQYAQSVNNAQPVSKMLDSLNLMLRVLYSLDLSGVTFDMFREVYQNILPGELRKSLGEFYTSDRLIEEALDAAGLDSKVIRELYNKWRRGERDTKIVDPACGSGSFLVAVVRRIFRAWSGERAPGDVAKFVEDNVIGIDINPFAVEMSKLNLIIAISEEMLKIGRAYVPEELQVYWADSLAKCNNSDGLYLKTLKIDVPALQLTINVPFCERIDPLEVLDDVEERTREGKGFEDVTQRIADSCGAPLEVVRNELKKLYDALRRIYESGNGRVIEAVRSTTAVCGLVGKCNYVIGNPPWVRIHEIGEGVRNYLKRTYRWLASGSGFDPGFKRTKVPFREQFDYSVAFVERGLELLRDGGVLSYVITSKIARATYAGGMREELVTKYTILRLIDYSLYPVPLFLDAVNYPLIIAVRKEPPQPGHTVSITVHNTGGRQQSFALGQSELSLYAGTRFPNRERSPWVLAPPEVVGTLKKILNNSDRLGDLYQVMMGVKTSLNEGYIGRLVGVDCNRRAARLELEGGTTVEVEEWLVHPLVRGEGIDAFGYSSNEYIIFPHDPSTLDPLWDQDQRRALGAMGLLQNTEVDARGNTVIYRVRRPQCNNFVQSVAGALTSAGFSVRQRQPCAVKACLEIANHNVVLGVNIDYSQTSGGCVAEFYIDGLRIPNASLATGHFQRLFPKLVRRDDYKQNLPPWAVFRASPDKFRDYRIAWRELSHHIRAAHLSVRVSTNICDAKDRLLIPIQTVYFITERDTLKALGLLIYLNSELVRSLVKLWTWTARGGYYRHTSYSMGMLPLPRNIAHVPSGLVNPSAGGAGDLNDVARKIAEGRREEVKRKLCEALGISAKEHDRLVEYGRWLNEIEKPPEIEVAADEEEGGEE